MRQIIFYFAAVFLLCMSGVAADKNFHSFTVKTIDDKDQPLSAYKGKVVLVLNVASKCGLTPQYKGLQELYEKYKKKGFEIVAFPANNFGKQEPGSNFEIKTFCTKKYGVTFNMMAKIEVKGSNKHELYKYLTENTKGGEISWNFEKFLIGPDGNIIERFKPRTKPEDKKLVDAITKALEKL